MEKNGYHTQGIGKMHVHPLRSLQGFHNVELHDGCLEHYRKSKTPSYEHQLTADDYFHWLHKVDGKDVGDTGPGCNSYLAIPWLYDEN